MAKFQYVLSNTHASWVERMYHGEVAVKKGVAETDNPLTKTYLLNHGFREVIEKSEDEAVPVQATTEADVPEATDAPRPKTSRSRKSKRASASSE